MEYNDVGAQEVDSYVNTPALQYLWGERGVDLLLDLDDLVAVAATSWHRCILVEEMLVAALRDEEEDAGGDG